MNDNIENTILPEGGKTDAELAANVESPQQTQEVKTPTPKLDLSAFKGYRVIKRYPNRKLYDTEESGYITLNDILNYLEQGLKVKILKSKTIEDVTTSTLLNALAESGKKNNEKEITKSLNLVSNYIQSQTNNTGVI